MTTGGPGKGPEQDNQVTPLHEKYAVMFEGGEAFEAVREWFALDQSAREQIIDSMVMAVSDKKVNIRDRVKCPGNLTNGEVWVLRNLSALTSETVENLFTIDKDTGSATDLNGLALRSETAGYIAFSDSIDRLYEQHGLDLSFSYEPDADDFSTAQDFFHFTLPVKDLGKLLGLIADNLDPTHRFYAEQFGDETIAARTGIKMLVPPVRAIDLISDDVLMKKLPLSEDVLRLNTTRLGAWLEQFLAQQLTPKPETLGRLATYGKNVSSEDVHCGDGVELPFGALMHAFLRRIYHLSPEQPRQHTRDWKEVGPEKYTDVARATAGYLLDDRIISFYTPYLSTPKAWDDVIIRPRKGYLEWQGASEPVAVGEEAKALKLREFKEVVATVVSHLVEVGDETTGEQLRQRY